ncbi:MAG: DUF2520 domain-containing protein [Bacteroidetes bacterium]|nr:DUF2520 domain-containing protein [Bacteroidota bacterium]
MIRVAIIGSGNVAYHLAKCLHGKQQVSVESIWVRNPEKEVLFNTYTYRICNDIHALPDADIYVLAVSDSSIASVCAQLPFKDKLVIHTSGATNIDAICTKQRGGVFYPLQSFSIGRVIDYNKITVLLETVNESDKPILEKLASAFSNRFAWVSSEERVKYHLAATLVNNFSNHFYTLSELFLHKNNLRFDLLKPLILETAEKVQHLSPKMAQTGPAKRLDLPTLERHLSLIEDVDLRHLYEIMTMSIRKIHDDLNREKNGHR